MTDRDSMEHRDDESHEEFPETLPLFPDGSPLDGADDDFWSGEDLERAYQEAVNTLEDVEQELPNSRAILDGGFESEETGDDVQSLNEFPGANQAASLAEQSPDAVANESVSPESRLQPKSIIEAALFVGGMPLTVKRLAGVLRDEFDRDFIERAIDELNLHYDDQNRPYEIRLEEGGYRMLLRTEFESVRNKSYGYGPKEVRLSQEALEVLALVAYRQPITKEQIEQAGKSNPNGVLRQLLRREIIGLERTGKKAKDVSYHTTARFLQVFGLADLSELPHSEDLNFK